MSREAHQIDRRIAALALPSLGALLAEPLFLLVDTALVGHLGAAALAGVGLGQAVLNTVVGLLLFLAYATTPRVARRLGANDRPGAIRAGVDGVWLAICVGAFSLLLAPLARPLVGLFGANLEVTAYGVSYLAVSAWGVPAMLIVLAATGLLRGLHDARTPLVVTTIGFAANALLNGIFIYGCGLGVVGSALGTVIAQWGMAAYYLVSLGLRARAEGVSVAPNAHGILASAGFGGWLLLRMVSVRVSLLATTFVATRHGTDVLAATQIGFAVFSTAAYALDALAIAGQAMIGESLGASDMPKTRAILRRLLHWGLICGGVAALVLAALSPVLGRLFTQSPTVLALLPWALIPLAIGQLLAGAVFTLDGILIGAGDARYLAAAGVVNAAACLAGLACVGFITDPRHALAAIWMTFAIIYLGIRLVTLGWRARQNTWMRLGA